MKILEKSHKVEFSNFNSIWSEKFHQFRVACKAGEQDLKKQHQEQYTAEHERLDSALPALPKHSSRLLNLRRMQEFVIKKKEFKEAHNLQLQMNELAGDSQERWAEARNETIRKKLENLERTAGQELQNYRQKALSGFNELKRQRAKEIAAIERRYHNLRQDVTGQQRMENSKLEASRSAAGGIEAVSRLLSSRSGFLERFTPHTSVMADNE